MSKTLDIIMAGVMAGITAFTTTQLGIGGTIIGAVIGSMLYQLMSHVVKEPVENFKTQRIQRIERGIFYIFPLIIIVLIEVVYLLSQLFYGPQQIFFALESATGDNLFKALGVGLIIMGLYPIIQPETIKEIHGYILLIVGFINLLIGFIDVNSPIVELYALIFSQAREFILILVIAAISYVIIDIIFDSINVTTNKYRKKELN